jgi:hypothetical protein
MKTLIEKPIVRFVIIVIAFIIGLLLSESCSSYGQTLSGNNGDIIFSIKDDSLFVDNNRFNMMPMLRYEFRFYFDDDKPLSMISNNNKMHGKIAIQLLESDKIRLKRQFINKIEIYGPMKKKTVIRVFNDKFYFVKYL